METTTNSVIAKMAKMDDNPLEFKELIDAWNTLCEQTWVENPEDFQFADIETAAFSTLSDKPSSNLTGRVGNDISRKLSTFDYPTYLVTAKGQVAAVNTAASTEFDLNIGDNIDQLPYSLEVAQQVSELVHTSLQTDNSEPADAVLKRAYSKGSERVATIAVSASLGKIPTALVFVITTQWKSTSAELLKNQFGLTDTESDLLVSFVDGCSTQEVAKIRSRSHATIRTQLQSVLAKTGARNQTELLRIALSLSDFSRKFGVVADAVNHPYRRRAEILREGGRLVEVTLMGDYNGQPILTIADSGNYTYSAQIEQQLYEAGLYVISVCGPGYGSTDPAPKGESRLSFLGEDVRAILEQLRIEQCPMMALNTNSPLCYAVTKKNPDRISHIVQIAALVPYRFARQSETKSSWINGILKTGLNHPSLKRILFRGAFKAYVTMGTRQFMRLQLSSDAIESKHMFLDENMAECEYALKIATRGGLAAAAEDMHLGFEDWSSDVEGFEGNISVLHGRQDSLFVLEGVRRFADAYPDKVTVTELDNAGFSLMQANTREVIALLRSIADQHCHKLANIPPNRSTA